MLDADTWQRCRWPSRGMKTKWPSESGPSFLTSWDPTLGLPMPGHLCQVDRLGRYNCHSYISTHPLLTDAQKAILCLSRCDSVGREVKYRKIPSVRPGRMLCVVDRVGADQRPWTGRARIRRFHTTACAHNEASTAVGDAATCSSTQVPNKSEVR